MHVEAIEQGTREAPAIAPHLGGRAAALARRIPEAPAGTGVHGGDELECGRILALQGGPRHDHDPGLERLAQRLKHRTLELRQLVEKQHAVVREADLAGSGARTAAHQGRARGGVVRRTERALPELRGREARSAHRSDCGHLQRFAAGKWRQQPRQALRQHALAGARRTDHEQAVAAGGGDHERALGQELSADVGEIERRAARARRVPVLAAARGRTGRQGRRAAEMPAHLEQVTGRAHPLGGHDAGLGGVGPRHHELVTLLLRVRGGEEQSSHGLELAGEAQLAVELARLAAPTPSSAAGPNLPGGDEDSERNGEVEPSALLG